MSLYEEILEIARQYMGPAAEDYVQRRIRIVQKGEAPEKVTSDRLERLAVGIDMTAKRYMSGDRARRFRDEVLALKDRRRSTG